MDKILLVDDEPAVLAGYQRNLFRDFEVETAVGGEIGLQAIRDRGPFAVIVSDMRMPGMNGATFLAEARRIAPDSVRMLLTGYTDLDASVAAVNEGNIFRFLTKPCAKERLVAALAAGVGQYQIILAEKELLEKTLLGSIEVFAEVLNAASPEAFHRSSRIAHIVRHVAHSFEFESRWRLEAAATLSQLGCVTLDTDLLQRAFVGMKLSLEDQARFDAHPAAAMRLLASVPRMEPVAWMIGQQLAKEIHSLVPEVQQEIKGETLLGAKILNMAVAYDDLRVRSMTDEQAIYRLRLHKSEFSADLLNALAGITPTTGKMEARCLCALKLAAGMIMDQEIRSKEGTLLIPKGQYITPTLLLKLQNYDYAQMLSKEVMVLVPA